MTTQYCTQGAIDICNIFQEFEPNEISGAQVSERNVYGWIMPDMRSQPDTLSDFGLRPGPVSNPNDPIPQLQRPTQFYFYKVYDRTTDIQVSDAAQFPQFTVTYGHVDGSGSASGSQNEPTKAIYRQYVTSALEREAREEDQSGNFEGFGFDDTPHFYAVNLNRDVQRNRIRTGQWELTLGFEDSSGNPIDIELIDLSVEDSSLSGNQEIEITYGTLAGGELDPNDNLTTKTYGYVYPPKGIIAINPDALVEHLTTEANNQSLTPSEFTDDIQPDLGSPSTPNHELLFDAIVKGASFRMQSVETVIEKTFSTTVQQQELNYSLNPTYSDPDGTITFPESGGYFTTIGLYNDDYELVAVAKVANPQRKEDRDSASIDIELEF